MPTTIKNFVDLDAWQQAHYLTLEIYKLTKLFPKEEMFGLSSQMRRASISIGSNIAEGFGRIALKEKIHFYSIALASTSELQSQLYLVRDLQYAVNNQEQKPLLKTMRVHKLINGLIKKTKSRIP